MCNNLKKLLYLLGAFLVLLSTACDPCDDPGTIEIDPSDRSFPELAWEITTRSMTPSGPASSIRFETGDEVSITMTTAEEVDIRLLATDNESGIEWVDLEGGFGITCNNPTGAIAYSGTIPGGPISYALSEMECGTAEGDYTVFTIDGTTLCTTEFPALSQGNYIFMGSASNTVGLISGSELSVSIFLAVGG